VASRGQRMRQKQICRWEGKHSRLFIPVEKLRHSHWTSNTEAAPRVSQPQPRHGNQDGGSTWPGSPPPSPPARE
jgi:hypothetical protein